MTDGKREDLKERLWALDVRRGDFRKWKAAIEFSGIDIPDATCMVIEHADIFGLAALHQLRGRVGRSTLPSYCFLVFGDRLSTEAKARLSVMKETNDGFRIAEKDLEIRGPGEMAGDRQSGFLRLRFASLTSDLDLIEDARKEAERIAEEDPGLLRIDNAPLRIALSKQG